MGYNETLLKGFEMNIKTLVIKIAFAPFAASEKKKLDRLDEIMSYEHPKFNLDVHKK